MILSNTPSDYLPNPVSFAFALLNEAVIKPTIQGIKDDWNKGLEEDFEIIHKPKGLKACKAFVDNRNINSPIKYLDVYTPTLQKLLKNEFLSVDEMDKYNQKLQLQVENSNNKAIVPTVLLFGYISYKDALKTDTSCVHTSGIPTSKNTL